jgi:hypothetical protein
MGVVGVVLLALVVVLALAKGWIQVRGWHQRAHQGQLELRAGNAALQRATDRACEAAITARSITTSGRWLPNGEPHEHRT